MIASADGSRAGADEDGNVSIRSGLMETLRMTTSTHLIPPLTPIAGIRGAARRADAICVVPVTASCAPRDGGTRDDERGALA